MPTVDRATQSKSWAVAADGAASRAATRATKHQGRVIGFLPVGERPTRLRPPAELDCTVRPAESPPAARPGARRPAQPLRPDLGPTGRPGPAGCGKRTSVGRPAG